MCVPRSKKKKKKKKGHGFATWVEKTVHEMEIRGFSEKKKKKKQTNGAVVNKEGHADCILGHKRTGDYLFP